MTSHPEEEIPPESDEDEPGTAPMQCPFLECPSSSTTKTRRALVAHLAAKHVSHGQVVPTATLQILNMRVCGDPCRTLVPAGTRCRNCRAALPGQSGSAAAEPGVPMPMLPPPACLPPRPGAPTSGQCPQLVPSFQDVLTAQVPTVRHIPAMCRSAVASELARLVREVAVPVPTWEALHRLLCFPKLVLRSSGRGGSKHQRQAALDLDKRLRLFQAGQLDTLWTEARALAEKKPKDQPAKTRARARMEEEGVMPGSQVVAIRTLVEEGALSKATKLLVSTGLANSQDPDVERVLRDLHPQAQPHLVAGDDLPP